LIIKNLIFDGNRAKQEPDNSTLQQMHLIFLTADKKYPGRLKFFAEDLKFINSSGDGIAHFTNVDSTIENCYSENCVRAGITILGGYTRVAIKNYTTKGHAIDMELAGDSDGYNGNPNFNKGRADLTISDSKMLGGAFDIGAEGAGAVISITNCLTDAPFNLVAPDAAVKFKNCKINIGRNNLCRWPKNVTFTNCLFNAVDYGASDGPWDFTAAPLIFWNTGSTIFKNESVTFNNCQFKVDSKMPSTNKVTGIYTGADSSSSNNILTVNGGSFDARLHTGLRMSQGGTWHLKHIINHAKIPVSWLAYSPNFGAYIRIDDTLYLDKRTTSGFFKGP